MSELSQIEQLILQVAQGNRPAFSTLYDRTSAKLYGICLRVLEDEALAQDVLQEAYLKIWRSAEKYQANGLSPMTWLITLARNSAIDRRRALQSKEAESIDDYDPACDDATPEECAVTEQLQRDIEECLETLEPDKANAVKGAYLEGLSYADLADQFSVPLNTMRTWLRRSLMKLKGCMGQ
ncbi:sigma-70 family RNA polymerase sigma factor [Rhodanobacter aciditrophus]|uniref:Sigma-70 family RNA polymerase sigma factor n=1 Tax=Rhodanobacter aciditrophus TaxID=1623218 RepID=A0ABW4AWU6_9GAMM